MENPPNIQEIILGIFKKHIQRDKQALAKLNSESPEAKILRRMIARMQIISKVISKM